MATTTNFGWETPDDTDFVKDGAAAIRTLGSSIDTSLVDLKGGTTGQLLAKSSNTDMDFSWVGSWTTWTPTVANFVKGNGTETARYVKIGSLVHLYYDFIFGSTSSISSRPEISLPVNQSYNQIIVPVRILDSGTTVFFGMATLAGSNAFVELQATNSTYSAQSFPDATNPMTWTTGDRFTFQATYEVAP
jgi:hypothetical protein